MKKRQHCLIKKIKHKIISDFIDHLKENSICNTPVEDGIELV